MKIALIDVDSHNFPNLTLMKLSAYHKAQGHSVEWWNGLKYYDVVYASKVFSDMYSPDIDYCVNAGEIVRGGTGYDTSTKLPKYIEHVYPDYRLYPGHKEAYGFLTRGCPRSCPFCIVSHKEGKISKQVAELAEFWRDQRIVKLLDPNLLAFIGHERLLEQLAASKAWIDFTQGLDVRMLSPDNIRLLQKIKTKMIHFAWDREKDSDQVIANLELFKRMTGIDRRKAAVYVLTNFDTDFEFDLYRVDTLRALGYDPYVMIYDKPTAPRDIKRLQGWVNNKIIWTRCDRFEDYVPSHRRRSQA
jgi:hypothetical protein